MDAHEQRARSLLDLLGFPDVQDLSAEDIAPLREVFADVSALKTKCATLLQRAMEAEKALKLNTPK